MPYSNIQINRLEKGIKIVDKYIIIESWPYENLLPNVIRAFPTLEQATEYCFNRYFAYEEHKAPLQHEDGIYCFHYPQDMCISIHYLYIN